jgi:hypothetical protein
MQFVRGYQTSRYGCPTANPAHTAVANSPMLPRGAQPLPPAQHPRCRTSPPVNRNARTDSAASKGTLLAAIGAVLICAGGNQEKACPCVPADTGVSLADRERRECRKQRCSRWCRCPHVDGAIPAERGPPLHLHRLPQQRSRERKQNKNNNKNNNKTHHPAPLKTTSS